jgi:hypothetical protein
MNRRLVPLFFIAVTLSLLFGFELTTRSLPTVPQAFSPHLASLADNFTSSLWVGTQAGSGPSSVVAPHQVTISIPPSSSNDPSLKIFGAGLASRCTVSGDFDVQVNFQLINWTSSNGVRVGLSSNPGPFFASDFGTTPPFAVERTSFGNTTQDAPGFPREVYLTHFLDGVQGLIPTSDLSGTLRLARSGGFATGYYLSSGNWIPIHSGPTTTQDIHLNIAAWSHDYAFTHTLVEVAFDTFTISRGTAACPGVTLNPTSGPVGTNVQVQVTGFPSSGFGPDQVLMSFDGNLLGIATNLNGTFSFTFNVPEAQPGPHFVKALDEFTAVSLSASFIVTKVDTLAVSLDVGTLYFPGDSASVYTLATLSGSPLNSTSVQLQLALTRPDGSVITLNNTFVGAGLFRAMYTIPKTGLIGTYAIVAKAHVANVQDTSALATFEVKPTWLSTQGPVVTTAVIALTGVAAVTAVVWRKGVFRTKNE